MAKGSIYMTLKSGAGGLPSLNYLKINFYLATMSSGAIFDLMTHNAVK